MAPRLPPRFGPRLLPRLGEDKVAKNRVRRVEPAPPFETGFIVLTDPEGNEFCLD